MNLKDFINYFSLRSSTSPPSNVVAFTESSGDLGATMLGRFASSALKNPAIDAAFKKIEAEIFTAWKTSSPKDEQAREKLYYRMEGLALIKVKLQGMVQNMIFEENKNKQRQP